MIKIDELKRMAKELEPETVSLRREFHAHPELGFEEKSTAARVASFLEERGIEHRTGIATTGILATIRGAKDGPAVLLRADMDGLPIQEENDVPYRSQNDGRMHACGHDGHVAILMSAADVIWRLRDRFAGTVRLAFQPAEEGLGGGAKLIEGGALEDPACSSAFALHVWNSLPVGRIGVRPGPAMAAADEFRITITGVGGHGAEPMDTADPVVAAAQVVTALQSIVSRNINAVDSGVVSVTAIRGGTAYNVIPDSVEMKGTLRSFDPSIRDVIHGRVREVATGVAAALGTTAEVRIFDGYPATVNDPEMARFASGVAAEVAGDERTVASRQVMGAEDFSYFLQKVPGAFLFLGSNNPDRGFVNPHHSPRFDFDEACLPLGVTLMSALAIRALEQDAAQS